MAMVYLFMVGLMFNVGFFLLAGLPVTSTVVALIAFAVGFLSVVKLAELSGLKC